MIYIIYLIILVVLLVAESKQAKANNVFRWVIPAIYVLLIGLRGEKIGVDTEVYYNHYFTFGQFGCDFVEPGFDWLNRFCFHLGWSQAPFFIICAAFAVFPVALSLSKVGRKEYSLFMLLFCTTTFISLCNGMRQNMACGLIFALLLFLESHILNKWIAIILYFATFYFASLFHASVLLILPIYLLKFARLSRKTYVAIYVLSFFLISNNISQYIPTIEIGNRDYSNYEDSIMMNATASSLGFIIVLLKNILILVSILKADFFKKYPLFSNSVFVMLVLTNASFTIPLMNRINMYLGWFSLLLISFAYHRFNKKENSTNSVLLQALLAIILIVFVYGIFSPANKVFPYEFY